MLKQNIEYKLDQIETSRACMTQERKLFLEERIQLAKDRQTTKLLPGTKREMLNKWVKASLLQEVKPTVVMSTTTVNKDNKDQNKENNSIISRKLRLETVEIKKNQRLLDAQKRELTRL